MKEIKSISVKNLIGMVIYYFFPVRAAILNKNLSTVFPNTSKKDKKRLTILIYDYTFKMIFSAVFRFRTPKLSISGQHFIEKALEKKKGVFLLTAHIGYWESVIPHLVDSLKLNTRIYIIRKKIKSKTINNAINRRYQKKGISIITSNNTGLDTIERALNENAIIIFPFDQYAGTKKGLQNQFFNKDTFSYKSLSILSRTFNVPVVPIFTYYEKKIHHIDMLDTINPGDEEQNHSTLSQTNHFNRIIEKMILSHPDQWFCWLHNRWKIR